MAVYHVIFVLFGIFCKGILMDERVCTTALFNATQANLGRSFFHRIIEDDNSYLDVNERTMCALMHFLFQEAKQNKRSIRFSSGLIGVYQNQLIDNLFRRYVCAIRSNRTILQSINESKIVSRS